MGGSTTSGSGMKRVGPSGDAGRGIPARTRWAASVFPSFDRASARVPSSAASRAIIERRAAWSFAPLSAFGSGGGTCSTTQSAKSQLHACHPRKVSILTGWRECCVGLDADCRSSHNARPCAQVTLDALRSGLGHFAAERTESESHENKKELTSHEQAVFARFRRRCFACRRDSWAGRFRSSGRATRLNAGSGDRLGESIVTTGPVLVRYDKATESSLPLDAVYILDYKGGRLVATLPTTVNRLRGRRSSSHLSSATWSPTSSSTWTPGPRRTS